MHPIERLRHVARAGGADPNSLVRAAAGALIGFGDDPPGLVTACRRLLDRHASVGPLWWLAARVLVAEDPMTEARLVSAQVDGDMTPVALVSALPDDITVVVLGWPDLAAPALARRGDIEVFVIDVGGYARSFVRQLGDAGTSAEEIPESGIGAAVADADLVLLEASALGPSGLTAPAGSRAAAAVGRHAGIPVWAVAGEGRVLPGRLYDALVARREATGRPPWEQDDDVVPGDLIDVVVGPGGAQSFEDAWKRADCPVAPELLKTL